MGVKKIISFILVVVFTVMLFTFTSSAVDVTYGDVNDDGIINIKDVTLIQKQVTETLNLNGIEKTSADVNLDSQIDSADVSMVQKVISKIMDYSFLGQCSIVISPPPTDAFDYKNTYTQAIIDKNKNTVATLQKSGDATFIVVTDIHIDQPDDEGLDQLRDVVLMTYNMDVDYVAALGDFIDEQHSHAESMELLRAVKNVLDQCNCPVYYTRGDHDFNGESDSYGEGEEAEDIITGYDFASIFEQNDTPNIVRDPNNPDGNYFYVDMPWIKQRAIFVNSYECVSTADGVLNRDENGDLDYWITRVKSNEQITWLVNEAMDMTGKSNWDVLFFSHNAPYSGIENHYYGGDNEPLRQIIKALMDGTTWSGKYNSREGNRNISADFTEQGAISVIGWFSGHVHDDCYVNVDGLNIYVNVNTANSQRKTWSTDPNSTKLPPARTSVETDMSVNLYVVKHKGSSVDMVKFGASA